MSVYDVVRVPLHLLRHGSIPPLESILSAPRVEKEREGGRKVEMGGEKRLAAVRRSRQKAEDPPARSAPECGVVPRDKGTRGRDKNVDIWTESTPRSECRSCGLERDGSGAAERGALRNSGRRLGGRRADDGGRGRGGAGEEARLQRTASVRGGIRFSYSGQAQLSETRPESSWPSISTLALAVSVLLPVWCGVEEEGSTTEREEGGAKACPSR
ncbi:hypothetical protein K438DRAFT_1763641 [Mycena galopus ATCC 62051]|nr:hypothetical protein K438DRAFT_1763641 [Mycena galopus ATCC 62051]